MPVDAQQIILSDGRRLCFAEYGDRRGHPLIFFHGWPSSRLEARLLDERAAQRRIHLVAPDRPGFGRSDFKEGRRLWDWPEDVTELTRALGIKRFSILGLSGGSPYVIACAWKIPERLVAAGIVSGLGPPDTPGVQEALRPLNRRLFKLGRWAPWLFSFFARPYVRGLQQDPTGFFVQLAADLPEIDWAVMIRDEIRQIYLEAGLEAFRQGYRGAQVENALFARPWGLDLANISQKIYLWHGEMDTNVPPAMGHYLADSLPNCSATFYENTGHISLIVKRMDEILDVLCPRAD